MRSFCILFFYVHPHTRTPEQTAITVRADGMCDALEEAQKDLCAYLGAPHVEITKTRLIDPVAAV